MPLFFADVMDYGGFSKAFELAASQGPFLVILVVLFLWLNRNSSSREASYQGLVQWLLQTQQAQQQETAEAYRKAARESDQAYQGQIGRLVEALISKSGTAHAVSAILTPPEKPS